MDHSPVMRRHLAVVSRWRIFGGLLRLGGATTRPATSYADLLAPVPNTLPGLYKPMMRVCSEWTTRQLSSKRRMIITTIIITERFSSHHRLAIN
jgi:hypothetical protein